MITDEAIENEIQAAWDELKHRGITEDDYTAGVNNVGKLVDIRTRMDEFEFNQKHREDREEREWFKAKTDRIEAEARMRDAEGKVEAAKYECRTKAIGTVGNIATTMIILLVVAGIDKEGNFPQKYLSIIRGLKL